MKNTKYFKTVQDVNNYYPDGVPSNVIAIVGDGSNVFISSDNAGSGNQQYYSADMTNDEIVAEQVEAAEQQGYDTGYTAGETAGYTAGETAGYEAGYADGQAAGGSTSLTTEQINNMSFGFAMNEIIDTGAQYARIEMCDLDVIDPYVVSPMFYSTGIHFVVDKYNDTTGLTADYDWVYAEDDTVTPNFISATVSLNAGDEVGFTLAPAVDDGMGGYAFEDSCSWLYRYVDPENTGNGYNTHFFHVDNTGDYEFKITIGTDPESGDDVASWTFTQVVQP